MHYRSATEADIPAIVTLLRQSLGESLMPKSEAYWRWKHIDNPFGASPCLLCWEGDNLIGVRAFMRWEWTIQNQRFRAVRAVDTATHPDHQGKGIFKNLTLSLVKSCTEADDHFVFNTPNLQSKPGYLKMGWVESGRLPVRFGIQRPLSILQNVVGGRSALKETGEPSSLDVLDHPGLERLLIDSEDKSETLHTKLSSSYLQWRYRDVPVAKYQAVAEERNGELTGLIIGRIKRSRLGVEFRVTDFFLNREDNGAQMMKQFREQRKQWKVDYTTMAGTNSLAQRMFPRSLSLAMGPVVTVRSLALHDLSMLMNFNAWSPSLGDLELF